MPHTRGARYTRAVALGGVSAAAGALALPWGASGRRWRSGFELLRVTRELGFASRPSTRVFVAGVFVVPVLAAAAWVLVAARARWATAAVILSATGLVVGFAAAVLRSPLKSGPGVPIGVTAGAFALVGAVGLLLVEEER